MNEIPAKAEVAVDGLPPRAAVPDRDTTGEVGARFVVPLALAYFGFWMAYLAMAIVSVPIRFATVLPENERIGALSMAGVVGGVVALLVNPLVGKLSDRTISRFGMRKPWFAGGTVVGVLGLAGSGVATSLPALVACLGVAIAGLHAANAALLPLISDHVPARQRGKISGLLGMGVPIGAIGGVFIVQAVAGGDPLLTFLMPAVLLVIGVAVLLVSYTDRHLDTAAVARMPRLGLREFASSFWVSPRRHTDFAWAWVSRFLIFLALAVLATYQAFFLISELHIGVAEVAGYLALATFVHYGFVIIASPLGGWLSDRLRRRKVFVGGAAAIYAAGLVVIATGWSFEAFLVGMAVTGIGEGLYLAVDLALVTDILPNPDEAGKEMGLITVATSGPPAVAPAIAPLLLAIPSFTASGGDNYVALFGAAVIFAILSALAIKRVKSAR